MNEKIVIKLLTLMEKYITSLKCNIEYMVHKKTNKSQISKIVTEFSRNHEHVLNIISLSLKINQYLNYKNN